VGFSFKRMFKNPFGKHSLFHKATQIASILPIPGAGLVGKAFGLLNRGRNAYEQVRGITAPILTAIGARPLVPSTAPIGVMPGGSPAGRRSPRKRAARGRRAPVRAARRPKRKLKFGSPAWRARYMKRR